MSWPTATLSETTEIISGGTPKSGVAEFWEGDVEWITPKDMGKMTGIYASDTSRKITELGLSKSSAKLIAQNSVILSTRAPIGHLAINSVPMATNQGCRGLVPNDDLDTKYLFYFLFNSVELLNDLGSGTTFKELSKGALEKVSIPLPPLPEQKRIVALLDTVFADLEQTRAKTEQNLKNARELFDSYLQQVFSQKGEEWKAERLENICTFSSGGTPSKKNDNYWNGDIPWVSGRDMKSTQLSDTFLHISECAVEEGSARLAPKGTLLTLVRGMGLAHGAQVAELMVPSAFNQDIKGLHLNSNIVPRYLVFVLRQKINSSADIISSAAHGTLKINMDALKNVVVPVPPTVQQEHIVDRLNTFIECVDSLESIYQKKLLAIDELKKSILQKAFNGELTDTAE